MRRRRYTRRRRRAPRGSLKRRGKEVYTIDGRALDEAQNRLCLVDAILARRCGVTRAQVCNIRWNTCGTSLDRALRIAEALGVSIYRLVRRHGRRMTGRPR